jgi:hypothetical protein
MLVAPVWFYPEVAKMARVKRIWAGIAAAVAALALAGCRGGLGNLFDVF